LKYHPLRLQYCLPQIGPIKIAYIYERCRLLMYRGFVNTQSGQSQSRYNRYYWMRRGLVLSAIGTYSQSVIAEAQCVVHEYWHRNRNSRRSRSIWSRWCRLHGLHLDSDFKVRAFHDLYGIKSNKIIIIIIIYKIPVQISLVGVTLFDVPCQTSTRLASWSAKYDNIMRRKNLYKTHILSGISSK